MDLRRAAQLVLRSRPLNNPFISTPQSNSRTLPSIRKPQELQSSRRSISTTFPSSQQAAAPKRVEEDESTEPEPIEPARRVHLAERLTTEQGEPRRQGVRKDNELNFLKRTRRAEDIPSPGPQSQTTRPQSPQQGQQGRPPLQDFDPHQLVPGTELSFLRRPPRIPPSTSSHSASSRTSPTSKRTSLDELTREIGRESMPYRENDRMSVDLSRMVRPYGPAGQGAGYSETTLMYYNNSLEKAMAPPSFRMGPSLGRTVGVDLARGMDVARAFAMVNVKCAANSVRTDFNAQRFHERPGIKRKRLNSQRWRKRFKESFRATVRRVEDLRRKGW